MMTTATTAPARRPLVTGHRWLLRRLWSRPVATRALLATRADRRASAILMVLAVLSILALLAITVSFTARLETYSAENYGVAVQNRMAALTGVAPLATALLKADPSQDPVLIEKGDPTVRQAGVADSPSQVATTPQRTRSGAVELFGATATAHVQARDTNARLNINAADESLLAAFFDELGRQTARPLNGGAIARAIVEVRLGNDGAPGAAGVDDDGDGRGAIGSLSATTTTPAAREVDTLPKAEVDARAAARTALFTGVDDPAEFVADIRLPALGDDVRFGAPSQLLDHESIRAAGLDEEALAVAEPYLTTFSVARDVWSVDTDEEGRSLLDINRASAAEILAALLDLYGPAGPSATQLAQYAVNLVDARDTDSIPTALIGQGGATVLGIERTPFITEVYPDSLSPDDEGDDGQFVELYNPWPEAVNVSGWTLVVDGMPIRLTGKIAPGGYLIVTDDAETRDDDETPGTGSLYDVFGVTDDGTRRRVQTILALDIEHGSATWSVQLRDAAGNPVDEMRPTPAEAAAGDAYSIQRENPLVRETLRRRATPFAQAGATSTADGATLMRLSNYPADGPFVAPSDALTVFAGFADTSTGRAERWAFPAIDPLEPGALDARVMDLFTVETLEAPDEYAWTKTTAATTRETRADAEAARLDAPASIARAPIGTRHGRVNPNTADAIVLQSLPGLGRVGAGRMLSARNRSVESDLDSPLGPVAFARPSDVLMNNELWAGVATSDVDRLARFRALEPHLTFNPQAFVVAAQPRVDAADDAATAAAHRLQAVVATDRGAPEILALIAERDVVAARRVDKRAAKTEDFGQKTSDAAPTAPTTGETQ